MNEKRKGRKPMQEKREYRGYLRLNAEEKHILFEYFGGMAGLRDFAVRFVKVNREKHGKDWEPTLYN